MTTSTQRLTAFVAVTFLGWTSLASGQTAPAAAPTAPPADAETVKLSEFTVSTDRDLGYYSSDTAAGSVLTGKPVKELALAISLINRDLLDDLQTTNIAEAMQFSASFNPENGLVRGQGAQMNAEGQFTNRVGNSTNGVPDSGAVERIELIKGPPSVLMSSASAGGAVNITPKRPQRRNFSELEYQYGNFQQRYRVEVNRVLTPKLGARVGVQFSDAEFNGASVQNQTNIPEFDQDRRLLIFGAVEWRPFPNTILGVDVEQVRDRSVPSNRTALRFATVTRDGQSVRLPWFLAYNVPLNWSITGPDNLTGKDHRYITARWSQSWTKHFKTEANLYNQWYNEKTIRGNQNIEESTTVAGLNGLRAVRLSSFDQTLTAQRTTQMAIRSVFDYAIRDSKHQLVLKYNYYTFYTDAQSLRAYNPGTNPITGLVAANEVKGPWRQVEGVDGSQLNSYDRSWPENLSYLWRYANDAHDNPHRHQGNIIYTGEYPTRIGTFFPLAGISYHSQIESFQSRYANVGGAITNRTGLFSRPHRWGSAPSAGIVWQVKPSIGIFSSYLESFQVPTNTNSFQELLPNREGVSYETGVKLDFFDRKITGTLSHFDTTDKNRAVTDSSAFNINTRDINGNGPRDPGFDANNLAANTSRGDTVAVGEYNAKGWDGELILSPGHGFQATLSATLVDAKVVNDPNPSLVGSRQGGFAKRSYATVLSYRFPSGRLKGLGIGGGYRYTSDRYLSRVRQNASVVGSPFVDYWQPPAKTLSVFLKYTFKLGQRDAWVQFNADNLLKTKRYINETSFTNLTIYPIDTPVVWRVTTGVRF
ncbi:MAG: TonB-dependent receptor plug domain-containing protein [Opitutaceae bacterium]